MSVKTSLMGIRVERWELLLLLLLALLALVPRLVFLSASGFGIESDEAIVGLMAKHVRDGAEVPVFYYGQHYMGSLEPLLTALVFALFGESNAMLKVVPLIFSLLHVALVYVLARRFVAWPFAVVAGVLTALAPATLLLWSGKARGGFIELVVLGTAALILAIDCMNPRLLSSRKMFTLGLLLGLGWWVNNQIVFYLVPIGSIFLFYFPMCYGLPRSLRLGLLGAIGFFLGSAPFWYANLFFEPRFATFEVLFGSSAGGNLPAYLRGFFDTALPIIIGARRFWSDTDVVPGASTAMLMVYAVLCCGLFLRPWPRRDSYTSGLVLLLLFCVSVPLIFSASSFGWLSKAPRYLLPLYSAIFVVAAIAIERFWRRGWRVFAVALVVFLLAAHGVSGFWGGVAIAGQPIVFRNQRVSESHAELYSWLRDQGYRHIHTNYWIGYRAAFETDEQITFSRYGHPKTLRIPRYESQAKALKLPTVYVLVPAEAALLEQELQQFGYRFRKSQVGGYVVLDQVTTAWPFGEQLRIEAEQVRVFNRSEERAQLFDNDLATRWGSGMPQYPGMEITVSLPQEPEVTGVEIEFGSFLHDAPRDLELLALLPDGSEQSLFRLQGTKTYFELQAQATSEVDPMWRISFAPRRMRGLILRQHGVTQLFDWSIAELRLFEAPQPAESAGANGVSASAKGSPASATGAAALP